MPIAEMNVLLLGSGGREHALAWKLVQSPLVKKLYCVPGNPGIAQIGAYCVDIPLSDLQGICRFAQENAVALTIVGPEAPLAAGIVDEFGRAGLKIFGPTAAAAQLEGSKVFAKAFMQRHAIPTAAFEVFTEHKSARQYLRHCEIPVVVKADGLAAGKGAFVCRTRDAAEAALASMMIHRQFGHAGRQVVIEECMVGEEVSILAVTDGEHYVILPPAQDHKALHDGDRGPNTGGMGAYAPAPIATPELLTRIEQEILIPTIQGMAAQGQPYRGVLYAGLMITADGPKVIEFNCRMGDPEAQAVLPLLASDFAELAWRTASGNLQDYRLATSTDWALTVVLAAAGYPGKYATGKIISGLDTSAEGVAIFHAGTERNAAGEICTSGGRVLGVTGIGASFEEARARAYRAAEAITFEGRYFRRDLGAKAEKHLRGE